MHCRPLTFSCQLYFMLPPPYIQTFVAAYTGHYPALITYHLLPLHCITFLGPYVIQHDDMQCDCHKPLYSITGYTVCFKIIYRIYGNIRAKQRKPHFYYVLHSSILHTGVLTAGTQNYLLLLIFTQKMRKNKTTTYPENGATLLISCAVPCFFFFLRGWAGGLYRPCFKINERTKLHM